MWVSLLVSDSWTHFNAEPRVNPFVRRTLVVWIHQRFSSATLLYLSKPASILGFCFSPYVRHVSARRCAFLLVCPWALRCETPPPQPRCSYISVQFVPRPQIEIPFSGGKLSPTSPSGTQWIKIQISLTLHRCSPTPLWLSPPLPRLHLARRFAPCPLISSPLSSPLLCSSHRWLWFPPCSQLHWKFTFLPRRLPPLWLCFSAFFLHCFWYCVIFFWFLWHNCKVLNLKDNIFYSFCKTEMKIQVFFKKKVNIFKFVIQN